MGIQRSCWAFGGKSFLGQASSIDAFPPRFTSNKWVAFAVIRSKLGSINNSYRSRNASIARYHSAPKNFFS